MAGPTVENPKNREQLITHLHHGDHGYTQYMRLRLWKLVDLRYLHRAEHAALQFDSFYPDCHTHQEEL